MKGLERGDEKVLSKEFIKKYPIKEFPLQKKVKRGPTKKKKISIDSWIKERKKKLIIDPFLVVFHKINI